MSSCTTEFRPPMNSASTLGPADANIASPNTTAKHHRRNHPPRGQPVKPPTPPRRRVDWRTRENQLPGRLRVPLARVARRAHHGESSQGSAACAVWTPTSGARAQGGPPCRTRMLIDGRNSLPRSLCCSFPLAWRWRCYRCIGSNRNSTSSPMVVTARSNCCLLSLLWGSASLSVRSPRSAGGPAAMAFGRPPSCRVLPAGRAERNPDGQEDVSRSRARVEP